MTQSPGRASMVPSIVLMPNSERRPSTCPRLLTTSPPLAAIQSMTDSPSNSVAKRIASITTGFLRYLLAVIPHLSCRRSVGIWHLHAPPLRSPRPLPVGVSAFVALAEHAEDRARLAADRDGPDGEARLIVEVELLAIPLSE